MSHPGKVITVQASDSQRDLPYMGVTELLIVADSSNNRILILDAVTNHFIEQIGNGQSGFADGSFAKAQFHHT